MSTDETKTTAAVVTVDDQAFVICNSHQQDLIGRTRTSDKRDNRKCIVTAVVIVIIATFVLTAILVGVYMFTKTEKTVVTVSMQLAPDITQEMSVDAENNIIEYHIQHPNVDAMVVEDYNNYISVTKLTLGSRVICFAKPFNQTDDVDLTDIDTTSSVNATNGSYIYYVPAKKPIPDISFLSKKAQTLCKGISVYWVFPMCADDDGFNEK